jgi:hypothetical protein
VDHIVQLFDDSQSRSHAVADFVEQGLASGERVLLVMTFVHWQEAAATLAQRGVDLHPAISSKRLVVRDAQATLNEFMRNGRPRRAPFDRAVAELVRTLASEGAPLRVYGEMVDVLAAEGDLQAAHELERLWNELGGRVPFTLYCGYSAVNFGNPATSKALHSICRAHSEIRSNSRDMLAAFLVNEAYITVRSPISVTSTDTVFKR